MTYKIAFKGQMGEEFVDDGVGASLMRDWENGTMPEKVQINGSLYDAKSIKAIIGGQHNPDQSSSMNKNTEDMEKSLVEFRVNKYKRLSMPAAERALFTDLAEVLWVAISGKTMTNQEKQEVISRQEKFFVEKPDYAYASPLCYKDMIKVRASKEVRQGSIPPISDFLPAHALGFVLEQVRNGIRGNDPF